MRLQTLLILALLGGLLAFGSTPGQAHTKPSGEHPFLQSSNRLIRSHPLLRTSAHAINLDLTTQEIHLSIEQISDTVTLNLSSLINDWWLNVYHTGFKRDGEVNYGVGLGINKTVSRLDGGTIYDFEKVEETDPYFLAAGTQGQAEIKLDLGLRISESSNIIPGTYTSDLVLNGSDGHDEMVKRIRIFFHFLPNLKTALPQQSRQSLQ